jgi:hypothetical protein
MFFLIAYVAVLFGISWTLLERTAAWLNAELPIAAQVSRIEALPVWERERDPNPPICQFAARSAPWTSMLP